MPADRFRTVVRAALLGLTAVSLTACGVVKPMIMKGVAGALSGEGGTVSTHNDPETVRGALDFALITNESILASVPKYEPLLTTTCSQYTQYAAGFLSPEAEALQFDDYEKSKIVSDRAFRLATRGKDFCWRALEVKFKGITPQLKADPGAALRRAKREHVPLLYWSAASLGTAISIGGLNNPELLIDWPIVRALVERALELDESYSRGALHELMITIEGLGEAMGGSEERARKHFDRAVAIQQGLSPSPYVTLAMSVVKGRQDYDQFKKLLETAIAIDPDKDPANRLPAILSKQRAQVLLAHIDELIIK